MFKISKRKVTKPEAELLIKEIKLTPNIVGYSLKEWMTAEHIMVAEDEANNLMGACLNYDFYQDWHKIAALFVLEEFRGIGLGKLLFYKSCEDGLERGKNLYTVSANEIVINMMNDWDFTIFNSLLKPPQNTKQYKFLLYFHAATWIISFYRIQEIMRKTIVYKSHKNFMYGVKFY